MEILVQKAVDSIQRTMSLITEKIIRMTKFRQFNFFKLLVQRTHPSLLISSEVIQVGNFQPGH